MFAIQMERGGRRRITRNACAGRNKRLLSSREKDENKKALEMKSFHYDHQGCLMYENCIDQHFDPIIYSIIVQVIAYISQHRQNQRRCTLKNLMTLP